ncbi:choline transporter-like protein 5-A isoform X2 [Dunckerocampus dactyliophorus]|uniref:choline transporter-like protein 5-A isoform X2 n=1 Tax=Dunckerocampus dactyliophorus TaxID=161453 RepID=UPI00240647B6|nr:choline transporter-like protein 5-A isoform X2 [Dunckerocampus dactyliophorus]XP_054623630.1 choline transporter-like protein 5-A isoform X2 [Dunckerocampus dactyliophorus]XP_054623631.1 choline transporter-like protein 5-A isoform X2 [Dunckerocampus dactyliophorus]
MWQESELRRGLIHVLQTKYQGITFHRRCTDVFCCFIFILVVLSYITLGIVAWLHGDPRKVLHPTNSNGEFCGQKGTSNAKRPILFYFNIIKCASPAILINLQCPTTQICVSKCPDKFATFTAMQLQHKLGNSSWEYYRQFCKPGFDDPEKPVSQVLRDEDCPSMIVPSKPYLQRCLPDVLTLNETVTVANKTKSKEALEIAHSVTELQDVASGIRGLVDTQQLGQKIVEDFRKSWPWILVGLLMSLVFSLIFIVLLRFTARLLLGTTIVTVMLLLSYGLWFCSVELSKLGQSQGSDVSIVDVGLQTDIKVYLQLKQTWIILLMSLGMTEVSVFCILVIMRRRVELAVVLLKEASRAIGHIMSTLFYPVITSLSLALCASYFTITAFNLASSSEAIYKVISPDVRCPHSNGTCNPETFNRSSISKETGCLGSQCLFALYGGETLYHRYLFLLQLSNLLIFLWLVNFSLALEQCTLAGTFSSYYWARRKPQDVPPCSLFSAFSTAVRYHTGSLAFGALILSVVQLFRIILEYLQQKLKGLDNRLSRFLICCLQCCFWCLEKFLCYMNRNAYIMMAIYGKNFCTSAREAFFLLMRNMVRVAVLDRVTDFLLFLGKVMIAGGIGVVAYFFFTRKMPLLQEQAPNLNYYELSIMTIVVGAYLIAHGFFNVYTTCVDTFFLCFCDDLERNDGSSEKPFLMSPELHRILGKH